MHQNDGGDELPFDPSDMDMEFMTKLKPFLEDLQNRV
jgi:hypothetical protein